MGKLFENRIIESSIFANKELLRPTYIPENLPHRKKQLKSLADTLSAALKGKTPSNLLIY
ncbi:MAG: cell division control protein Cdc6, partial [Methanomicrobia archaeon]|nr:cell division control protein Cdc6 [Methanomicrobia archaeon]